MGFFKKSILKSVTGLLVLALFAAPCYAAAENEKYASLVIDAETGSVLHQENAGKKRYPASLTKMMTLYLAFQSLEQGTLNINQKLRVSSFAASQSPSSIALRAGQTITMQDAINAVVIKSANDASVVLAEAISGSEPKFALKMTETAKKLGMKNTNFANASGLPNNKQVTTAYDMARLAVALKRDYPQYYPLFSRSSFKYKGQTIFSHNRVTKNYRGADGLKTGYIRASGFNLVTSANRSGKSLVGVVMGGRSIKSRDANMVKLLDQAFYNISNGKSASSEVSNTNTTKNTASNKKQKNTDKPTTTSSNNGGSTNDKAPFSRNVAASAKTVTDVNEPVISATNTQPSQEVNVVSYEQAASSIDIEEVGNIDEFKPKRVGVNGKQVPVPTFKEVGIVGTKITSSIEAISEMDEFKPIRVGVNGKQVPVPTFKEIGIVGTKIASSIEAISDMDELKPIRVGINGRKVPIPTFKPQKQESGLANTKIASRGNNEDEKIAQQ